MDNFVISEEIFLRERSNFLTYEPTSGLESASLRKLTSPETVLSE